jgi:ribosomal protein L28
MNFMWLNRSVVGDCTNWLQTSIRTYVYRPTRTTGKGRNVHRSKRAQEGLYHGKDVQFGRSIAHSGVRSLRRWNPNVINKRVWSDALEDWVRFKMTTRALKEIDNIGGIDNYLLALDNDSVAASNYVTKMRGVIATTLFTKQSLSERLIRKLGYHKNPPNTDTSAVVAAASKVGATEESHLV